MKRIVFIFACLMLGIMTSSCSTGYVEIPETNTEPAFGYEYVTDDAYRSWIVSNQGEVSVMVPYVALYDEDYLKVSKEACISDIFVTKHKKGFVTKGDMIVEEIEYRVDVDASDYKLSYRLASYEYHCSAGSFFVIPPEFKLINCSVKELPGEKVGEDECYCTEVFVTFEVKQEEKVSVISHRLTIKEIKKEILINPIVKGYVTVDIEEWISGGDVIVDI